MNRKEEILIEKAFNDNKCSFIEGVNWANETTIKRAQEYLRTHLWEGKDDDNDPIVESVHNITLNDFIKDFTRYLEE